MFQPKDPAARALAAKNKGNKYFKGGRYELAIKCYTQAIEVCPQGKNEDLSTFYQNRAAAYEQLVRIEQLLIERKEDLRLLNPDLLYSLVYAFGKMHHKSEILYLIEPHILKNL